MDHQFKRLVTGEGEADSPGLSLGSGSFSIRVSDQQAGEVEIDGPTGTHRYMLRPLSELYAPGSEDARPDPLDERYLPLFLSIEESILLRSEKDPSLTDGQVTLALDRLGMSPEADPGGDPLARDLQAFLRLQLSLNDYSRQAVRGALRKIAKSVARHTRDGGPRGYLRFIREQFRR